MSKIRIQVTKEDIDVTEQGQPEACMVWRAVCRNLQLESQTGSTPTTVQVLTDSIHFIGKKGRIRVPNSTRVERNITRFDQSKSLVQPFNFDLDLPDNWREMIHQGAAAAQADTE